MMFPDRYPRMEDRPRGNEKVDFLKVNDEIRHKGGTYRLIQQNKKISRFKNTDTGKILDLKPGTMVNVTDRNLANALRKLNHRMSR